MEQEAIKLCKYLTFTCCFLHSVILHLTLDWYGTKAQYYIIILFNN